MTWIYFILLVGVIGLSGYHLCKSAEDIGDYLGVSDNWIGAVMLATVTSMPELISGITAVNLNLPDLAVGNALGGNVFNLMLVFALDLFYRKRMLYSEANHGHLLTGALGIVMMGVLLFLFMLERSTSVWSLGHVGFSSLVIPLLYLLSIKTIYQFDKKSGIELIPTANGGQSVRVLVARFSFSALTVVLAGMALPHIGQNIIVEHGWNASFVGTVFMAMATSCPEMAVTLAAIRLNAINLALSNLLASNIFNLVIITFDDFFYVQGPILSAIAGRNVLTIISGILMTALVMIGLVYRPSKRVFNTVSGISLIILGIYIINNLTLYKLKD